MESGCHPTARKAPGCAMRCADAYTGVIGALLLCQALFAAPSDGSRKQAVLAGRRGCMLSLLAFDTGRERGCNGHWIALGPAHRGGHGGSLEMFSTVPGRNGASIRVPWSGYRFLSLLGRGGKCPWFGKKFLTGTDGVLSLCARYKRILGCCGQCKRHNSEAVRIVRPFPGIAAEGLHKTKSENQRRRSRSLCRAQHCLVSQPDDMSCCLLTAS